MRIGRRAFVGILLAAGSMRLADATVVYPEETAAMREAWVSRAPSAPQPTFAPPQASEALFYLRIRGCRPVEQTPTGMLRH